MPYKNQPSSCLAHMGFFQEESQIIQEYVGRLHYATPPDQDTMNGLIDTYGRFPVSKKPWCPETTIAIDGSRYAKPTNDRMPSTQVGYVRIGMVALHRDEITELNNGGPYVDPTIVAEINKKVQNFHFLLPGSNVLYKDAISVKDGFREVVNDIFQKEIDFSILAADSRAEPRQFSLARTLMAIIGGRAGRGGEIELERCSCCGFKSRRDEDRVFVFDQPHTTITCPDCGEINYCTDVLKVHDGVSETNDATGAINRFMITVEHMMMATRIIAISHYRPDLIGDMAFVIDGPLAIFGPKTPFGEAMMRTYYDLFAELDRNNYGHPLLIGLQKQGALADHAALMEPNLPVGSFRFIDDFYRNLYISPVGNDDYGKETYYGQDVLMKPSAGRIMCVSILYPFRTKAIPEDDGQFRSMKVNPEYYAGTLERVMDFLVSMRFDMYPNAIMPIEMAHTNVAISINPSGRFLDMLTKKILDQHHGNEDQDQNPGY